MTGQRFTLCRQSARCENGANVHVPFLRGCRLPQMTRVAPSFRNRRMRPSRPPGPIQTIELHLLLTRQEMMTLCLHVGALDEELGQDSSFRGRQNPRLR